MKCDESENEKKSNDEELQTKMDAKIKEIETLKQTNVELENKMNENEKEIVELKKSNGE